MKLRLCLALAPCLALATATLADPLTDVTSIAGTNSGADPIDVQSDLEAPTSSIDAATVSAGIMSSEIVIVEPLAGAGTVVVREDWLDNPLTATRTVLVQDRSGTMALVEDVEPLEEACRTIRVDGGLAETTLEDVYVFGRDETITRMTCIPDLGSDTDVSVRVSGGADAFDDADCDGNEKTNPSGNFQPDAGETLDLQIDNLDMLTTRITVQVCSAIR